mgnify:FL=1
MDISIFNTNVLKTHNILNLFIKFNKHLIDSSRLENRSNHTCIERSSSKECINLFIRITFGKGLKTNREDIFSSTLIGRLCNYFICIIYYLDATLVVLVISRSLLFRTCIDYFFTLCCRGWIFLLPFACSFTLRSGDSR